MYTSFNGEIVVMKEDGTPMHSHTHKSANPLPTLPLRHLLSRFVVLFI